MRRGLDIGGWTPILQFPTLAFNSSNQFNTTRNRVGDRSAASQSLDHDRFSPAISSVISS